METISCKYFLLEDCKSIDQSIIIRRDWVKLELI